MENGDHLNPGFIYDLICTDDRRGYANSHQSATILPWPGDDTKYILFHKTLEFDEDQVDGEFSDNRRTMMTVIDMKLGEGLGAVTIKNDLFDTTRVEPTMYFNRHANGEDWWMLSPHRSIDVFSIFLIDSAGVHFQFTQQTGLIDSKWTRGGDQGLFNPAGDQFYRWNGKQGMQLFDFDRETGMLSNFRHIPLSLADQTIGQNASGGMGVSPSGQYAYTSNVYDIFQYDLWAEDVGASRLTVGEVGNPDNLPQGLQPSAFSFQLGPDCKLYSFAITGDAHHVIHNPDERGLACGWEQGGLQLPFPVFRDQIYYPNFRLGPLGDEGSPCAEPIVTSTDGPTMEPTNLSVYPNPATGPVTLSLAARAGMLQLRWELITGQGRIVRTAILGFGEDVSVQLEGLPAGMYFWRLSGQGHLVDSGKLIVE
ncbi:T9SS type A sorting domain-containing protein [Neolewinella aurantiaca]|uniref:T9SS type A sorting domain-containing protein n=1 Tax=Neolewinella aurantiaca TaxID=2602767 RepID=A0A5C7FMP2_9BACT|nr:T9SS type A sorting domain-containing protein [Neolewinella aurantiaca]TXF87654.1 T9SS type A sorting domain-containing protein [Neolewinella aurantiaca]